ncbi:hypothetical protein OC498_09600 [Acinetobacter bohemicus]|uniref:hypothetical protein n=1 Tax=Acinetobacter TaxID=469 RepID=UPI00209A78A5|nr:MULTISPECIES: hypothetical protein [Acinetobacter]MCO8043635.1 hypothetical protein [Acinetobacter sp. S4400-12]MCU7225156.1 hypothetical protein [Acinetobacter bohemicus]
MDKTKIEINNITIQHAKKIILAHSKKGERYILTNIRGYLSAHWESTPTHHQMIQRVWDLEIIKSQLLNNGAIIDWSGYQYVLNHFEELSQDHRSPAEIIANSLKDTFTAAAEGIRRLVKAWEKLGYEVKK